MIKIKMTSRGGYVVGDGPCPFNPDDFLKAFGEKCMRAWAAGQDEIEISDEEVAAVVAEYNMEVDAAPVIEIDDRLMLGDGNVQRLLENVTI